MLKKIVEGLMFGAGFAISYVVIWYVSSYLILPMFISQNYEQEASSRLSEFASKSRPIESQQNAPAQPTVPFHELNIDDQIKQASVIALARFESASDGKRKAIIKEFLKKEPGVTIYYNVGDEYPSSSYYPSDGRVYGDGVIIFFVGSPASMRMSVSFSGNRIRGLSDLPIELLKKKCEEPDA